MLWSAPVGPDVARSVRRLLVLTRVEEIMWHWACVDDMGGR